MNAIRLTTAVTLALCALGFARGGTFEWTGEGGDWYWTTPENWKGGKVPGTSDIAVFDPGEGGRFSVGFANHSTIVKSVRILSGRTTFGTGKYVYLGNATTNEVYVADGATFVSSNVFMSANNAAILKTGGGRALFTVSFQKERYDKITDIREGTLQIGATYDQKAVIGSTNIVVRSGARLALYGPSVFASSQAASQDAACLNIEADATVYYEGYNGNTASLSSINGAGTFEIGALYNTYHNFRLTSKKGPSRFSGKFLTGSTGKGGYITVADLSSVPDGQKGFVVGSKDTLAGLGRLTANKYVRFAEGVGAFDAKEIHVDEGSTLTLEDEAGKPIALAANVVLKGNAQVKGAGRIVAPASLTVDGTDGSVSVHEATVPTLRFASDNASVTLAAGRYHANGTDTMDSGHLRPAGVKLGYAAKSNLTTGRLTVSAGSDLTLNTGTGEWYGLKEVDVAAGGTVRLPTPYCAAPNVTAEDPSVLKLDGGTVVVHYKGTSSQNLLDSNDRVVLGIGEKGGTLTTEGLYDSYQYDNIYLAGARSAVGEGTDGGLTLDGCPTWFVNKPFTFTGTSRIRGTLALIQSAAELAETPAFFGAGDIELDSCAIGYHKNSFPETTGRTCTLNLATAEGKRLTANGAPVILLQGLGGSETRFSSRVPQNVEIGELAFKPGALLVLSDYSGRLGTAGNSSVKVLRNAPAVSPTSGRVLEPVLLSTGFQPSLVSYDADAGFCKLANTVSAFAGAEGKVVSRGNNADITLDANTAYAADGVVLGEWCDVVFGVGSTLTVGDGTSPAIVAMSGTAGLSDWNGRGALVFGTAPGYVVIGASRDKNARASVNVKIRSAKTMTFASYPDYASAYHYLDVGAANDYEGDTYVNDVILYAKNTGCFSTGTVHVAGGQFAGGNVAFAASGTWANDFELSGWGFFGSQYGGNDQRGAFSFQAADSVVAGNVELKGDVRISSAADKMGTLTGVVSGDKLRVINSLGTIVLANDNTYTGGTEVICSTLTLKTGSSAGTGAIMLDRGVLRFENEEPITFANDVWCVGSTGRVVVAGAPVTFEGPAFGALPFKTLAAGTTLDLLDASQNRLVPYFAADTDLGGRSWAVSGVAGAGRISNGTLTVSGDISPAGEGACGTLEFAEGVLVSDGATYVCDVTPDGEDRLVVNGAFDLSGLAFRMVAPDHLGAFQRTVMTSGGTFTGSFSEVSTPRRTYRVACGETDVTVSSSGLAIIVR